MKILKLIPTILIFIIIATISIFSISGCTSDTQPAQTTPSESEAPADTTCQHEFTDADCTSAKTCKSCGETEGEALGHVFADADCTAAKTCKICGETEGEALGHVFADADCTTAKACKVCGETDGEALGHDFANADCTTARTCRVCGFIEGGALGHDFADANCTAAKTCKVCDFTEGEALGHDFADANCTAPKTCKACGATEGDALGHDFADANCTTAKTCKVCGATDGEVPGHNYADATCTVSKTCTVCGVISGSALGHDWIAATTSTPQTCQRCGISVGSTLSSIIPDDKNLVLALNNIPIANSSMTTDELRDIVVAFMKVQLTFAYTPSFSSGTSYSYYIKNLYSAYNGNQSLSNLIIKFEEGKYYGGIPYMGNAAGSIYRWLPFYDVNTGVMNWDPIVNSRRTNWKDTTKGIVYPDVGSALFGNSCSSACFWAWGRVSNKIASCWTKGWLPKNGFVKVGNYQLAKNDTAHGDDTRYICIDNGMKTMYESYAAMKKADGLLQTDHAIMIVADPVVVYKADGSIDGDNSYVCVAEQKASFLTTSPTKGGVALYSPLNDKGITYRIMGNYWGTTVNGVVKNMEWSFKKLFDNGFIPFTAPELVGQDTVQASAVTFTYKKNTITISQLSSTTLGSNYAISDVHFTVKDKHGNETYIGMYAKAGESLNGYRSYSMSDALNKNIIYSSQDYLKTELNKYTSGDYTLIITCRVSTGELLTVYTGTLK